MPGREGADLKTLLGIPGEDGPPEYHLAAPQSTMEAVEQGNQVATQERRRLDLGSSALPDLARLIASQGVWAAKVNLPDEMSGMFLRDPSFGMAVLINEKHPLSRRRFSFAHEYGHALMDRRAPATVTTEKNRKDFVEVRSNAFAAAFLLPSDGVESFLRNRRKAIPSRQEEIVYDPLTKEAKDRIEARSRSVAGYGKVTYQDVASLSLLFGTSYQAACYLRNYHDAEEITQQVFLRIHQRPQTYKPGKPISPWLMGIASNEASDFLEMRNAKKRRDTRPTLSLSCVSSDDSKDSLAAEIPDQRERLPDEEVALCEMLDGLQQGLADLRECDRDVIRLVHFKGMSHRQAAEALGIPEGTVRTRNRRGLAMLREMLDEEREEKEPAA